MQEIETVITVRALRSNLQVCEPLVLITEINDAIISNIFYTPPRPPKKKGMDQCYMHGTMNPHRDVMIGIVRT
jgi:hypothetical protein